MKKLLVPAIVGLMLSLAGCDEGEPRCAVCNTDFSDSQCMQIAVAAGCTTGESYLAEEFCDGTRRGCRFLGCPTDRAVMCDVPATDGGM